MTDIERLTFLADSAGLGSPVKITPIAAAASSRRYYRMTMSGGAPSLIGAIGSSQAENRAFVAIARVLDEISVAAPRVLAVEDGAGAYIVTDLGDRLMMDAVNDCIISGKWENSPGLRALEDAMRQLPVIQYGVARRLDMSVCYPRATMDRRSVMWDLNHFKYCFLKAAGDEIDEEGLEDDFERLADMICRQSEGPLWAFILRDCQSRNVMLAEDGSPQWIDFQGGRMGPVTYDIASMIWHARAHIPAPIRSRLVDCYLDSLRRVTGSDISRREFDESLRPVLLLRFLQVAGTYGLRGLTQGNAAFITPIPALVDELSGLLPWMDVNGFNALAAAVRGLYGLPPVVQASETRDELIVTVMSFSYKRGLPRDYSGNGGGFIFDCRYPDNPGRYEPYKRLTGLDPEVIEFIERDGELPRLVERAIEMVTPAVETYRSRGFTHLSISFGCTGGQHRSVYSARCVGEALNSRLGVAVRIIHREQNISQSLDRNPTILP